MKNTYRVAKILKKLVDLRFGDSFQKIEISKQGKEKATQYYQSHPSLKTHATNEKIEPDESKMDRETYIHFQKEVKASHLFENSVKPKAPGKVLKLPIEDPED